MIKHFFYSIVILFSPQYIVAQTTHDEVAVTNTLIRGQDFGLIYRHYMGETKRLRVGITHLGFQSATVEPDQPNQYLRKNSHFQGGAEVGLEKTVLTEGSLSVYIGAGIKYAANMGRNRTDNPTIPLRQQRVTVTANSYGMTFFSGLAVKLSERIFTNLDISPSLMYFRTRMSNSAGTTSGFDFSLQPDILRLMIGYTL